MQKNWVGIFGWLILTGWYRESAIAQIQPDRTLGTESSVVAPNVLIRGIISDRIEGGAVRGDNLFHSFQEFNIGEVRGAYFANPTNITNIFSRVTGSNPSNLMGTLGVLGNANLYFLNPNGIVFGANARLDVRGSFIGSTASSFKFTNGSEFSATDPQAPPLLQMSVLPGLQYGANSSGATIVNRGMLSAGQDLTLQAAQLDLQGQLQAGRNLTLEAIDTVQIRDSISQPFVAQAGEKLLVQGNQAIDIFALNHPNSGLVSGGDMVLRSANAVGGDAHYWTGGNFRIEQLDGNLGNLYSPNDPIIYSNGDVVFSGYRGASLHILAGGKVEIPIGVWILRPDTTGEAIYPGSPTTGGFAIVTLSNGQTVTVQGNTQATVDIRAGVQLPVTPNLSSPNPPNPLFDGAYSTAISPVFPNLTAPATSADITIGDIRIDPPDGLVLLTNQYRPNLSLSGGNIIFNPSVREVSIPGSGVLSSSTAGNSGAVLIDARGSVVVNSPFNTSSTAGNGGVFTILAKDSVGINAPISTTSALGNGGSVLIDARSAIVNSPIDTGSAAGNGGSLTILAKDSMGINAAISTSPAPASSGLFGNSGAVTLNAGSTLTLNAPINTVSYVGNGGAVNLRSQQSSILLNPNAKIETFAATVGGLANTGNSGLVDFNAADSITINAPINTTSNAGRAGDVTLRSQDSITINQVIDSSTSGSGTAGDVTLRSQNSITINQNIRSNTFGSGAAGSVNLSAPDVTIQGDPDSNRITSVSVNSFGSGSGGTLKVFDTARLILQNLAQFSALTGGDPRSSSLLTTGQAGTIDITTTESVNVVRRSFIAAQTNNLSTGAAGKITITTPQFNLRDGSLISAASLGSGAGGAITFNVIDTINLIGNDEVILSENNKISPSAIAVGAFSNGQGGNLVLNTGTLRIADGAQIYGSTGETGGNAANVTVSATRAVEITGSSALAIGRSYSSLSSDTFGDGNAGILSLTTPTLSVTNGGRVSAGTTGSGEAGQLVVNAVLIQVDGRAINAEASRINFDSYGAGNAGGLNLQTQQLSITGGGRVSAATANAGLGGALTVNATDSVTIAGEGSSLSFEAKEGSTADARGIDLTTNQLQVLQGGKITVSGQGSGKAGNLTIAARSIFMDNGARLTATTAAATGGNITLKVLESITLRRDSDIRAEATGTGNGGNITLSAGRFISAILSENSDVLAFAPQGQGGRITAKAQGIFGFQLFQGFDTLKSDFVASGGSDLLNGVIDIDTRNPQPSPPLPQDFADPQVAQGCQSSPTASQSPAARSQYFHTGTGGLSTSPSDPLQSQRPQVPWNTPEPAQSSPTEIREAQGWVRTADGRVRLVGNDLALLPCSLGGQP
jgi:filamentous hemagglutinin family protein